MTAVDSFQPVALRLVNGYDAGPSRLSLRAQLWTPMCVYSAAKWKFAKSGSEGIFPQNRTFVSSAWKGMCSLVHWTISELNCNTP